MTDQENVTRIYDSGKSPIVTDVLDKVAELTEESGGEVEWSRPSAPENLSLADTDRYWAITIEMQYDTAEGWVPMLVYLYRDVDSPDELKGTDGIYLWLAREELFTFGEVEKVWCWLRDHCVCSMAQDFKAVPLRDVAANAMPTCLSGGGDTDYRYDEYEGYDLPFRFRGTYNSHPKGDAEPTKDAAWRCRWAKHIREHGETEAERIRDNANCEATELENGTGLPF